MAINHEVRDIVKSLKLLGIEVPKAVQDLHHRLGFELPETMPVRAALLDAAATAMTEAEFEKALYALGADVARAEVKIGRVGEVLKVARHHDAKRVFAEHLDDLYRLVAEKYNAGTEKFSEILNRIPDLSGMGVLDMPADAAAALLEAREAVQPLQAAYTAYMALVRFDVGSMGHNQNLGPAQATADRLGVYPSPIERDYAVELIRGYARNDGTLFLKNLGPHAAVVRAGGRLELRPGA